jgi:O-acetylhomoserine/O-acetylserine sulfhydrylase
MENCLGLPSNGDNHERAKTVLKGGFGGVLSVGIVGGNEASKYVINSFKLISNMTK